jgi:hypothetical protein
LEPPAPVPYGVTFDLRIDRPHRLIHATVGGIPSAEEVGWIAEEVRAAILSLGPDAGRHRTLYDVRRVPVLPQATTDMALRNLRGDARAIWADRLAFVAATALTRRQVRRIAEARPGASVFDDLDAALAWLLRDGD